MKFRKKPIVIDALQWLGTNADEMFDFGGGSKNQHVYWSVDKRLKIKTPNGLVSVSAGEWVIRGIENEYYPCANSVFAATYEAVEDEPKKQDEISGIGHMKAEFE